MLSTTKKLRYAVEYGVFRLIAGLIRLLPVEAASAASGGVWRAFAPFLSRHRRAVMHLAAAFPDRSRAEIEAIARAMWANLGRTFAEAFHLDEYARGDRVTIDDEAALQALAARPGGAVFCSLHAGNWELAAVGGLRAGLNVAGVYQKIKNPYVDAFVTRQRAPLYPGGLYAKAADTAAALMRHARKGGAVAMLADLRERKGEPTLFFGRPAPTSQFPAYLARTLDLPLYAVRVLREPGARFRLFVEEVPVPRGEDRKADVAAATQALHAAFERYVRAAPDQWMWAHRRWG
ncbi:MAG: lipid A biosynthesis acyltransferase [Methylobacteriaceae bacterium]|nr:lipid A biosynthesis acyltransferase [Methylobacteriaceae bacterium]